MKRLDGAQAKVIWSLFWFEYKHEIKKCCCIYMLAASCIDKSVLQFLDSSTPVQARDELLKGKDELPSGLTLPRFEVSDLESLTGKFDTVICLDVLIHYPQNKADAMIAHLASLAENRLILSFAPKTLYYDLLKRVGELFPGPSKATRAYLHAEADIERALQKVGWKIRKRGLTTTQFYFSRIVEAIPK